MKRILYYFILPLLFMSLLFSSCEIEDVSFDENLLIGKWNSGTVYYKYLADYTGGTWDTADDVLEEEAQPFEWSLEVDELTHIHIMEMGSTVPKVYTVIELTVSTLKYEDDFGKQFVFQKVVDEE